MAETQLRLFPEPRPLVERFGAAFFRSIPRRTGVYVMTGEAERVLYVGKAKDLRERICSYKYPQGSRKVQRLGWRVRAITWEICADSAAASLRENELLRLHKPVFNVLNTRAEHYPFVGLRPAGNQCEVRITKVGRRREGEQLYGAFKGLPLVRAACGALLRLIWLEEHPFHKVTDLPGALLREKPPESWRVPLRWHNYLAVFLGGLSDGMVERFAGLPLAEANSFVTNFRARDLELLREFYARGPRRNRALREVFEVEAPCLDQAEIDDLLVLQAEKSRCAAA